LCFAFIGYGRTVLYTQLVHIIIIIIIIVIINICIARGTWYPMALEIVKAGKNHELCVSQLARSHLPAVYVIKIGPLFEGYYFIWTVGVVIVMFFDLFAALDPGYKLQHQLSDRCTCINKWKWRSTILLASINFLMQCLSRRACWKATIKVISKTIIAKIRMQLLILWH